MRVAIIYAIAFSILLCSSSQALGADSNKFKLKASVTVNLTANIPNQFHDVQVLSAKATKLYVDGDLLGAERLYLEAIALATKVNAPPETIAMLTCNLAAVYRQQKKSPDAAKYFEQAVVICRSKGLSPSVCEYVAKQYAPFLRRRGLNADADALLMSAKSAFIQRSIIPTTKPEPGKQLATDTVPFPKSLFDTPQAPPQPASVPSATSVPAVPAHTNTLVAKSPADEEKEVAAFVEKEASQQLMRMAGNEPNPVDWKITSGPSVTRETSNLFAASVEVVFVTTANTQQGKVRGKMIGVWQYKIEKSLSGSLTVIHSEMPFDVNRSTVTKL